jgi:putative phage-type endonuclease
MIEQRSEEWFKQREGRVTGSIAGALLGLSPYMSISDAIGALTTPASGKPVEQTENPALMYGVRNEEHALADLKLLYDIDVKPCGFFSFEDWLGASPDGLILNHEGKPIAVAEIKCPYGKREDEKPEFSPIADLPHYYAQVQIEMHCTGTWLAYFFQWNRFDAKLEAVPYDPEWIYKNLPRLREIWDTYIGRSVHPMQYLIDEYQGLSAEVETAKNRMTEIVEKLREHMNDEPGIIGTGRLTRTERQGSISYAQIVKEHLPNLDLDPYRGKPSVSWSLKT